MSRQTYADPSDGRERWPELCAFVRQNMLAAS